MLIDKLFFCCKKNIIKKKISQFISYNIIDYEHNIIIGTFNDNYNASSYEGISIGDDFNMYKILFGISHENRIIELYFENNIKMFFTKESNLILIEFYSKDIKFKKIISKNTIKEIKPINQNSDYIDLIFTMLDDI